MKDHIIKRFKDNWLQTSTIVIVACILIYSNYAKQEFLNASLIDIFTLIFASLITFYLTEKVNDNRRRNDCIEQVIMEIEKMILGEDIFKKGDNTLIYQASCANRIMYLQEAGFENIQKDIDFIANHFKEIRDLYSNHNSTNKELNLVIKDFRRQQSLICDKCMKIRIGLYK